MDAVATIMFGSGKMWCLFEGGYYSRVAFVNTREYTHVVRIRYSSAMNMASQMNEVFCFSSIVHGHSVYKTV